VERRPAEPLRSNARRNRERILEVAHDALTASSTASLNRLADALSTAPGPGGSTAGSLKEQRL
jgi:hypothetical protein